jgi:hypothetical protein
MRAVGKILANGKLEVTLIDNNGTSEVILKAGSADRKFVNVEYTCKCEGIMHRPKTKYDHRIKTQKTDWVKQGKANYTFSAKNQLGKVQRVGCWEFINEKILECVFCATVTTESLPIEM